jgi:hypothetical protein
MNRVVEPGTLVPRLAEVAVRRLPPASLSIEARCMRFHVMNTVLRWELVILAARAFDQVRRAP